MTDKFKGKYRTTSTRLKHWDYGLNAAYFVTLCTQNRKHFFGHIDDNEMYLSKVGEIVVSEWLKTPDIRPDMNLELGEFVAMPNHFHAIVMIGENEFNRHKKEIDYHNSFAPQAKNLSAIIRGFKAVVTKKARSIEPVFEWQTRFYEHVVRNEKSFMALSEYIQNNPLNWKKDELYSDE